MPKVTNYVPTTQFPIRFDKLRPGSLFRIHAEASRGMKYSRDNTIYRKAREHEGFFAYDSFNKNKAACLMPEDTVIALKVAK